MPFIIILWSFWCWPILSRLSGHWSYQALYFWYAWYRCTRRCFVNFTPGSEHCFYRASKLKTVCLACGTIRWIGFDNAILWISSQLHVERWEYKRFNQPAMNHWLWVTSVFCTFSSIQRISSTEKTFRNSEWRLLNRRSSSK